MALLLLYILRFHILSHISHNLNVLVRLWKIARLIRPPCANFLLTVLNFQLTSIRCETNHDNHNEIQNFFFTELNLPEHNWMTIDKQGF